VAEFNMRPPGAVSKTGKQFMGSKFCIQQ